jgi:hypothetical protein
MNDAYAVKVLTAMRYRNLTSDANLVGFPEVKKQCRQRAAALSCAIRALTGKRPSRRKTPKFVARA